MRLRNPLIDGFILALVLGGINILHTRTDFGWFDVNPTPWLLLPLLLGARHGFGSGLIGGLATIALIAMGRLGFTDQSFSEVLKGTPFTFLSLPVIGALAGEVHRFFSQKLASGKESSEALQQQLDQQKAQLGIARESLSQVQNELLLHQPELIGLENELPLVLKAAKCPGDLLPFFREKFGVTEAAFYKKNAGSFELDQAIGDEAPFPRILPEPAIAMVSQAVQQKRPVTGSEVSGVTNVPYIAAISVPESRDLVLLVRHLPYNQMNPETLNALQTILNAIPFSSKLEAIPAISPLPKAPTAVEPKPANDTKSETADETKPAHITDPFQIQLDKCLEMSREGSGSILLLIAGASDAGSLETMAKDIFPPDAVFKVLPSEEHDSAALLPGISQSDAEVLAVKLKTRFHELHEAELHVYSVSVTDQHIAAINEAVADIIPSSIATY